MNVLTEKLTCSNCGYLKDTPNHEYGCQPMVNRRSLKMLREDLCRRQAGNDWPEDVRTIVDLLFQAIDRHRPLGPDGKHGPLHTNTCGC